MTKRVGMSEAASLGALSTECNALLFRLNFYMLHTQVFFPKRFLSWGFKTLFASASSCQCKPPHFSSPAGLCRVNLDPPRSSGAHKILTELLCPALELELAIL